MVPIGSIIIFPNTSGDIPDGWLRCDGTLGTPDMRGRVCVGSGLGFTDGTIGGGQNHDHVFDAGAHQHTAGNVVSVAGAGPGEAWDAGSPDEFKTIIGTTGTGSSLQPWIAFRYIIRVS